MDFSINQTEKGFASSRYWGMSHPMGGDSQRGFQVRWATLVQHNTKKGAHPKRFLGGLIRFPRRKPQLKAIYRERSLQFPFQGGCIRIWLGLFGFFLAEVLLL
jgi:hypothetical protein